MWIVVVLEHYYPSVFHFSNEKEAKECYERNKTCGFGAHLAWVQASHLDKTVYEFDENKIDTLDVEWYASR